MLGHMLFRKEELRFREYDRYRAFYCGLCHALSVRCGPAARFALSYEMTFLSILLTSLYDDPADNTRRRCALHPLGRHAEIGGPAADYCADLSAILAYYDLLDGWEDERRADRLAESRLLRGAAGRAGERLPRQREAVETYIRELHAAEKRKEKNLDCTANLAGQMLAELYDWREDVYSADLRQLGFAIGKFVSLADSYEDLEKDEKRGGYNPLLPLKDRAGFVKESEEMLSAILAPGADAFERLPLVDDVEILRNILYSGIWQRVERATRRREKGEKDARSV